MFTVYWSSLGIGILLGIMIGTAVAIYAAWVSDKEILKARMSEFSNGFDKGWECGREHQKLIDKDIHL